MSFSFDTDVAHYLLDFISYIAIASAHTIFYLHQLQNVYDKIRIYTISLIWKLFSATKIAADS